MTHILKPEPDDLDRANEAEARRVAMADPKNLRPRVDSHNNGELNRYPSRPTNFHKGLPHNQFGIPDAKAFAEFVAALNGPPAGAGSNPAFDVPLGPENAPGAWKAGGGYSGVPSFHCLTRDKKGKAVTPKVRNWESPLGGHAHDLEGPDAGAVGMAPVPRLPFSELCAEMAEVYAMALLRDLPFAQLADPASAPRQYKVPPEELPDEEAKKSPEEDGPAPYTVQQIFDELAGLHWLNPDADRVFSSNGETTLSEYEKRRRKARFDGDSAYSIDVLFRGSTKGAKQGPYLSQFLLMGSATLRGGVSPMARAGAAAGVAAAAAPAAGTVATRDARNRSPLALTPGLSLPVDGESDQGGAARGLATGAMGGDAAMGGAAYGFITFGSQSMNQRGALQLPGRDFMTDWPLWLDVQNAADTRDAQVFIPDGTARFIHTPRALATYVHYDQLYQAYFGAMLLMLDAGIPFDHGFPSGPYHATRGSFATFGGPHILSLMTEVATRGLKAVRRQKFQHHLRGRPEQLAAMLTLAASDKAEEAFGRDSEELKHLTQMIGEMKGLLALVDAHNKRQNELREDDENTHVYPRRAEEEIKVGGKPVVVPWDDATFEPAEGRNYLLPMAFPEGSPMHASYGAGHATVAGACVTVLKAYFEMSGEEFDRDKAPDVGPLLATPDAILRYGAEKLFKAVPFSAKFDLNGKLFVPPRSNEADAHSMLADTDTDPGVTLEGELDKLAANIAIGRNMAGVHFYNDYFDSLRLGERVAVGILQEQMATYREPVTMRLTSFDNDWLIISGDGKGRVAVDIVDPESKNRLVVEADVEEWWTRHVPPPPAA
ncbi:hypothetical protein [Aurantimonas sp. HBX-1]|uniref:hypothetical protein n=1 Tax=Aurantimonas sp. HBX-1 TaxID=2906072 RepID=UPI001F43BA07|nr:hypothetical protein [Aurantimonas sp. HBX-1]UIJ70331.1 hypothetical protein LXB15_11130 [Aurantimonas sp. HBX-1]